MRPRILLLLVLSPLAAAQQTATPDSSPRTAGADPAGPDPELLALFDYDREADLEVREEKVDPFEGYERVDLSYASPAGGRVPGFLYQPTGEGPYAGILLMHGMPGDRTNGANLAERYARSGAVVLAISAPWARPDGPRPDVLTMTEKDRDEQIQLIQDLRRGVDLLESLPWVDGERLAYVGGSYGGAMGGLLAGVERRIRAFVLIVGDGGLVAHSMGAEDEIPPEGVTEEEWEVWLAAMEPIEPIRFVRHASPSHLLFQNGRTDQLVPAADAAAYHAAASEPKTVLWYDGGHGISQEMIRDHCSWLAEEIGIRAEP